MNNKEMDDIKKAYFEACLRFADACHGVSVAYEKGADMGLESPVLRRTIFSGLRLAMNWEKMCLGERIRHCASDKKIKEAENNIRRLEEKMEKYRHAVLCGERLVLPFGMTSA